MTNLIISTCGTSIFSGDAPADIRKLLIDHANARVENEIEAGALLHIQQHVQQRKQELLVTTDFHDFSARSAEIAALVAYYGGQFSSRDHHILLTTDTWLCEQSAHIIEVFLQAKEQSTEIKRLTDLRTDDLGAYRLALSSLVDWLYQIIPDYKKANYRIVFNLTGGFKAVQGFMQTLGSLLADECVYVFERSEQLIRLPRLPVKLQAESYVRDNLRQFRRMSLGLTVPAHQIADIPELFLFVDAEQAVLSEWGEVVWRELRDALYSEALLSSPSDKLCWDEEFERSISGLEKRRLREINVRIADVARFLETGKALKSTDFKAIKGPKHGGSTHEMDAWHDGDARRIFGHYEGERFKLDQLDTALH